MTRMLNIREYDEDEGVLRLVGRFDVAKATSWSCVKDWDGRNQVDVHTRDYATDTTLYRTAGGRWVLRTDSRWVDTDTHWEFIRPDEAREWLLVNGDDNDVATLFGEDVTAEFGPEPSEVASAVALVGRTVRNPNGVPFRVTGLRHTGSAPGHGGSIIIDLVGLDEQTGRAIPHTELGTPTLAGWTVA